MAKKIIKKKLIPKKKVITKVAKRIIKKPAKAVLKKSAKITKSAKTKVGEITHFFDKISVAVIKVSAPIKQGDKISIEGSTTDFGQKVDSMQVEHKQIKEAKKGLSIGMKVAQPVREKDTVYKV